jgi:hypothetical protein
LSVRRGADEISGLVILLFTLPWVVWTAAQQGGATRDPILGYYTDYVGWWAEIAPWGVGRYVVDNAYFVLVSVPAVLFGVDAFGGNVQATGTVLALALGLLTLTGILRMPRDSRCLRVCLAAYFALLLVWPWPPFRFLVPAAPFLAAILLRSGEAVLGRLLPQRTMRITGTFLVALALAGNLASLAELRDLSRRHGYPFLSTRDEPVSWASYKQLFAWLARHAVPDDVIASGLDPTVFLYSGRTSFRPFVARPLALFYGQGTNGLGTVGDLDRSLEAFRARYVVQTPLVGFSEERAFHRLIGELRARDPRRLERVITGDDPRFVVYRVRP